MTHDDSFCLVLLYVFYDIGSGFSPGSRYPTMGFIVDMFHNINKFAIWQKLKAMVFLFLCPPTKIVYSYGCSPRSNILFWYFWFRPMFIFCVLASGFFFAKCPEILSFFNIVELADPRVPGHLLHSNTAEIVWFPFAKNQAPKKYDDHTYAGY